MTDGEYGRLQKWADGLHLVIDNETRRGEWRVMLPAATGDGKLLAKHRSRSLALRLAKKAYDKSH